MGKKNSITNWKSYIKNLYLEINPGEFKRRPIFHDPTSQESIEMAENKLGLIFPSNLKSLLLQTNGIGETVALPSGEEFPSDPLIFEINYILEINQFFREDSIYREIYMPFENLLFISSWGNGDYFGYTYSSTLECSYNIFIWDHETDDRIWVATGLEDFTKKKVIGNL